MKSTSSPDKSCRPACDQQLALLRRLFFNRTDRVAFRPPWSASACPAEGGDNLDAMLAAHLAPEAPEVNVTWRTSAGKSGVAFGRFRIGSYSPAADGTTVFAVLDFDGDEHRHPLADPFGAAVRVMRILKAKGIVAHLEMSGSAKGWHLWIFFSEPVSAAKVRQLLFALIPTDLPLANDQGRADPKGNTGVEVFPKQDVPPEVGNQVWLPWWHGAKEGGNQFCRVDDGGEIVAYMPDDFETVTPAAVEAALATIPPPPRKHRFFTMKPPSGGNWDGAPTATYMLDWALRRASANTDGGRNNTGSELARQLRDNKFSKTEAETIVKDYAKAVSQDGHTYCEREAVASVRSAYTKPARDGWTRSENGHQKNGKHESNGSANGTASNPRPQTDEPQAEATEPDETESGSAAEPSADPQPEADADQQQEDDPAQDSAPETAAESEPAATGAETDLEVREAVDDPHRLARLFRDDHLCGDWTTLWQWRLEWYTWDGAAYRLLPVEELRGKLSERIKEEFDDRNRQALFAWEEAGRVNDNGKPIPAPVARKVSGKLVADVQHALAGMVMLPGALTDPAWLGLGKPFPAAEVLACNNTLIHLPSWANGVEHASFQLTPAFFSVNALDYPFDATARPPALWLDFLRRIWPSDPAAVETLQEWFGYSLLPDTSQQKILMVVGPKRSGKGTIARILRAVIGAHNTASPTLASLGTNFGLWPLLGKTLAIISDARLSGRTDAAVVVERLLSISGEDDQTVDRKNMSPVTTRLNVRFVVLTNELPRVSDPSGAFVGRIVMLRQTLSFYGREDKTLTARLLTELPQILLWAMQGWKRLRERGYFVQPDSGRRLVENMEDLASPIGEFINDRCELGPAFDVFATDLYGSWKGWCEEVGRKEPGTEASFGRDLRAALPALDDRKPRHAGKRLLQYIGIRLRQENDDYEPDQQPF